MRYFILPIAIFGFLFSSAQINYPTSTKALFHKQTATKKQVESADWFKQLNDEDAEQAKKVKRFLTRKEVANPDARVEIEGLGNFSSSQNGEGLSPSANVFALLRPLPSNGNLKAYLGFNLGAEIDSTKIDSIKLASLFLPDRGKSGYLARVEFNLLSLFNKGYSEEGTEGGEPKYIFQTELNPFVEYNYHKINIGGALDDSSKIQTSTWIFGLNFIHTIKVKDNSIGIHISPFFKTVTVTDGTLAFYREIFKPALKGGNSPQTVRFAGLSLGLQVNRFIFSFILEDLKTKSLSNTPLYGGVYTLRATVSGEFLKL